MNVLDTTQSQLLQVQCHRPFKHFSDSDLKFNLSEKVGFIYTAVPGCSPVTQKHRLSVLGETKLLKKNMLHWLHRCCMCSCDEVT